MDAVLNELLATSENGRHVYVGEKFSLGVRFFIFSFFHFFPGLSPTFFSQKLTLFSFSFFSSIQI